MYRECEICGAGGERVIIVGGYPADVCLKHRRELHDYVRNTTTFDAYKIAQYRAEAALAAVTAGTADVEFAVRMKRECDHYQEKLYNLGEAWMKERRRLAESE